MQRGIFIALGSNLGNREENLNDAIDQIELRLGKVLGASSIYETPPFGFEAVQQFYNMVIELQTEFPAAALMTELLSIERKLGRERRSGLGSGYESRPIDLDILYYGDQIIEEPELQIPHKGIPFRRFVTLPLTELAPEFRHPILHKTNVELNKECADHSPIRKVQ